MGRKLTACCHERPARTIALLLGGNRGRTSSHGADYDAQTRLPTTVAPQEATECPPCELSRGGAPEVEERRAVRPRRAHCQTPFVKHPYSTSGCFRGRHALSAVRTILHVVIDERRGPLALEPQCAQFVAKERGTSCDLLDCKW